MNTFSYRPNLLFLIWIRNKHPLFLLNHKLNKQLYYQKLIIALTTKVTGSRVNGAFKSWKVNGKFHRDDGPACMYGISINNPNGIDHCYYKHGKYHKDDGPAIIYGISNKNPNGNYHYYYQHGIRHRDDGPAIINGISTENPNGTTHIYCINGKYVDPF